jgi:hypothetical protein
MRGCWRCEDDARAEFNDVPMRTCASIDAHQPTDVRVPRGYA